MGQSVSIKIADRFYTLKAESLEIERLMRLAAEDINRRLASYDKKFSEVPLEEKLAWVCVKETILKISSQESVKSIGIEAERLEYEIAGYLKDKK